MLQDWLTDHDRDSEKDLLFSDQPLSPNMYECDVCLLSLSETDILGNTDIDIGIELILVMIFIQIPNVTLQRFIASVVPVFFP